MSHLRTVSFASGLLVVPAMVATTAAATATESTTPLTPASTSAPAARPAEGRDSWVAAWATSPQGVYPVGWAVGQPGATDSAGLTRIPALPNDEARDQSLRMIVRPTLDGDVWRLRLSNAFGTTPVTFDAVSLAEQNSGSSITPDTRTSVTFGGKRRVTLAAGEVRASDPISFRVRGRGDDHVAVSLSVEGASGPMTWHATSFATSYVSRPGSGDRTGETSGASFTASTTSWFYVAGLDVRSSNAGSVVALGDSITDGWFSTLNGDDRWPDQLERRLRARGGPTLSVVNQGIGGNMVTNIGRPAGQCTACDGPYLHDRLQRDVISQPGVRAVILLEGINDLGGGDATAESVIAGMKRTIDRLHAHGIPVIGGTITPSGGADDGYGTDATDAKRRAVNEFIRTSGTFDDVADFAAAVEDPRDRSRLKPEYATNSTTGGPGDKLHPGRAGFTAMANAVDLDELTHLVRKGATAK